MRWFISPWAIILPWMSRTWTSPSPFVPSVHRSGMQTIVTSSMAARPPMPSRLATSPANSVASTSRVATAVGATRLYLPTAGARCASGRLAPVSSRRMSSDCALTLVSR